MSKNAQINHTYLHHVKQPRETEVRLTARNTKLEEELESLKNQARDQQTIVQDLVKALAVRDSEIKSFSSELRSKERQMTLITANKLSSVAADLTLLNDSIK